MKKDMEDKNLRLTKVPKYAAIGKLYHGRAELDAAGFIRAEEKRQTDPYKKIRRKFYFCKNQAY